MKRIVSIACLLALCTAGAFAQDGEEGYFCKKFLNISYTNASLTQTGALDGLPGEAGGKFGVSLTRGRTFFLPISAMPRFMKVGVDAVWADITYRKYKARYWYDYEDDWDEGDDWGYDWDDDWGDDWDDDDGWSGTLHEINLGFQVGASLQFNPVSKMGVRAYFRYAPTFEGIIGNGDHYGVGYGSYFYAGCSVTYSCVGLGIEGKWGSSKMNNLFDPDWEGSKLKTKTNGFRLYLTFVY